jgi:hypothetical protein
VGFEAEAPRRRERNDDLNEFAYFLGISVPGQKLSNRPYGLFPRNVLKSLIIIHSQTVRLTMLSIGDMPAKRHILSYYSSSIFYNSQEAGVPARQTFASIRLQYPELPMTLKDVENEYTAHRK